MLLGVGHKYEPPKEIPTARTCNEELITLAEQILQDEKYREPNHERLMELDPSLEMQLAVELMNNKDLEEIVKEVRNACSKSDE